MRSTIHTALDAAPSELVFGRDMMSPMAFKVDREQVRLLKKQINKDNVKDNTIRLDYNYFVGDRALTTDPISKRRKLQRPTDVPFIVTCAHDNGTIRM